MSEYAIPEPDCSDKSLVRRSDIYTSGPPDERGVREAFLIQERKYRAGDPDAREVPQHRVSPIPTPRRKRRETNVEVDIVVPPTPHHTPQEHVPQQQVSTSSPIHQTQPQHWLLQLLNIIMRTPSDSPGAAMPDTTTPDPTGWQLIKFEWESNVFGWEFRLCVSHSARRMFLGLIVAIILIIMGKLTNAVEIFAPLFY